MIYIPLKTISEANSNDHYRVKAKRKKMQREMARKAMLAYGITGKDITGPLVVKFVRIGKRTLDDDNLSSSFKAVRDGVADALGVDDGDERMRYHYGQRTGKEYAIEIGVM